MAVGLLVQNCAAMHPHWPCGWECAVQGVGVGLRGAYLAGEWWRKVGKVTAPRWPR